MTIDAAKLAEWKAALTSNEGCAADAAAWWDGCIVAALITEVERLQVENKTIPARGDGIDAQLQDYRAKAEELVLAVTARDRSIDALTNRVAELMGERGRLICLTCDGTHRMWHSKLEREVPCTHCPTPCRSCACNDGLGAYCATAPCACACHARKEP